MGLFFIPLALLTGLLVGFPENSVFAGTIGACVVRFVVETIQDWMEASL